ncbi:phosphate ABC transporter substrate-binding protein PstS [Chitinimonas sp.]|uniref:phosphate ABC transporter substrate-binding protein PstS n=1 Tax=Chitinimonas sp. TaxID=1934313 RepID=UPI002F958348
MHLPLPLRAALLALLLTPTTQAATLAGAGSTFAEPLYKAWGGQYAKQASEVAYDGVGSGEGLARIAAGKVDFGASDEPLQRAELEQKGLRQFPVAMGAIVPVVNLPGLPAGELKLGAETLAKIYLGKITRWRDQEILINNDPIASRIPDLPIRPLYRADGSGSTFVLSYFLAARSADWKKGPGVGKELKGVAGSAVKGTGGMVEALQKSPGGIAYVDYGRALKDKLNMVQLPNRVGIFIKVSPESVLAAAKYDAENLIYAADPDFYFVLSNNDTYGGWPLATATFAVLPRNGKAADKVIDFLLWGYRNGDATARELGYVPLSETMKIGVRKAWSRQYGYKISQ